MAAGRRKFRPALDMAGEGAHLKPLEALSEKDLNQALCNKYRFESQPVKS